MSLLLPLLLAAIAKPQAPQWDLTQKVTYRTVAKQAKQVCQELEKIANIPLETVRDTANEVLVIDVKDVPLKQLLDKIAKVSSAEWQSKPHGYTLLRPTKIARKEYQDEIAFYAGAIKQEMQKLAERVAKQTEFDDQAVRDFEAQLKALKTEMEIDPKGASPRLNELWGTAPTAKLIDNLCLCLKPERLAALRPGDVIAFSSKPSRMAEALGPQAEPAIQQFAREWRVWTQNTVSNKAADSPVRTGPGSGKMPDHVLITCKRDSIQPEIQIFLYVLTVEGDLLDEKTKYFRFYQAYDQHDCFKRTQEELGEAAFEQASVFSPLALKWSEKARPNRSRKREDYRPTDPGLLLWASDPVKNDPLSLHPSEILMGLAKSKTKQLVANLSDQAMTVSWWNAIKPPSPTMKYKDLIIGRADIAIQSEDGWLTAMPALPSASRRERLSRTVLRAATQKLYANGCLSLDDVAAFAMGTSRETVGTQFIYRAIEPFDDTGALGSLGYNYSKLAFYGSLSLSQKKLLAEGGRLVYRDLPPAQKALFDRILYTEARPCHTSRVDRPDAEVCPSPFEQFPNGVPPEASVTLVTDIVPIAVSTSGYGQSFRADTFARELFAQERPGIYSSRPEDLELLYRVGTQAVFTFRFDFAKDFEHRASLSFDNVTKSQKSVPFSGLPASFKAAIQSALETYRQLHEEEPPKQTEPPKRV